MAKTEGTYIQVVYKNVFGHISTNLWPFFMIQRPTIRGKCAWVRTNTWQDKRPVATSLDWFSFSFSIFQQTLQLATEKIQNLCNRNRWSGLLQLGSVQFRSFFQSSELDLWTLIPQKEWEECQRELRDSISKVGWVCQWERWCMQRLDYASWNEVMLFVQVKRWDNWWRCQNWLEMEEPS